jgi:glutathione S-transferase
LLNLYKAGPSPFVRKVEIFLHEAGLTEGTQIVPVQSNPLTGNPVLIAANPAGKIPVLETETGQMLFDSDVICRYLDHRGNLGFYPTENWHLLTLASSADAMLTAIISMTYEARFRPDEFQFEPWVDGQWAKISSLLDTFEGPWAQDIDSPFNIAQINLACALGFLDFRHANRNWRDSRPTLAKWATDISTQPSLVATEPQ